MPITHSLTTRGVNFAFLFGPPRRVERKEAALLHGAVCEALGLDDIAFRYASERTEKRTSRGFSVQMERHEGEGTFRVVIDHGGAGQPIRLLMEFNWPPSLVHVSERFDIVSDAVFNTLEGEWQRVMAEARMRAQYSIQGSEALAFLRSHVVSLKEESISALGDRLAFASLRLEVSPGRGTSDPMAHPRREVTMEVLREDRSLLYFELMSQWTQIPAEKPDIDVTAIRPIDQKPSAYIQNSNEALSEWASTLSM